MRIFPLGEEAITVEFSCQMSLQSNDKAIQLAALIEREPFPGFIECVPAYASVTVFFDLAAVRFALPKSETAFDAVAKIVNDAVKNIGSPKTAKSHRLIEISVSFATEDAPDLTDAAAEAVLSRQDFIDIFLSQTYRVYMLGFLPGFAYMGELDERIACPRLQTPRQKVPRGSVGIAGRQTGIYPLESPGGWRLIGRSDAKIFNPSGDPMCCFTAGDEVRFLAR